MSHESVPVISYQTVKLSKGMHSSPESGACVMELASMIAGEPFSDRPRSVCPVIAAFLRVYNDSLDDRRRQDLYRCAAQVLGTRATPAVEQRRIERCLAWASEMRRRQSWLTRVLGHTPFAPDPVTAAEAAALAAAKAIARHTAATHTAALSLIDELCTIGCEEGGDGNGDARSILTLSGRLQDRSA